MPLFALVCPDLQKARHPILDSAGVVTDVEKVRDRNVLLATIIAAIREFPLTPAKWQVP
jgi:hypothetical protein